MWFFTKYRENAWSGRFYKEKYPNVEWSFDLFLPKGVTEQDSIFSCKSEFISGMSYENELITLIYPVFRKERNRLNTCFVQGNCLAVLEKVELEKNDLITSIQFYSQTLDAWLSHHSCGIEIPRELDSQKEEINFSIPSVGDVKIKRAFNSKEKENGDFFVEKRSLFEISFYNGIDIQASIEFCTGIERLFGFLVGWRPEYPIYNLYFGEKGWGKIDITNTKWIKDHFVHPRNFLNVRDLGGANIADILEKYFQKKEEISSCIHAVENAIFFNENLFAKFSSIMPTFEKYIIQDFTNEEEESFKEVEKKFFSWVEDNAPQEEFKEFCKKHLCVVERKSASLRTLICRAIQHINKIGFHVAASKFSSRIASRRGAFFHGVPMIKDSESFRVWEESSVVTLITIVITLEKLGIDVQYLPSAMRIHGEVATALGIEYISYKKKY